MKQGTLAMTHGRPGYCPASGRSGLQLRGRTWNGQTRKFDYEVSFLLTFGDPSKNRADVAILHREKYLRMFSSRQMINPTTTIVFQDQAQPITLLETIVTSLLSLLRPRSPTSLKISHIRGMLDTRIQQVHPSARVLC